MEKKWWKESVVYQIYPRSFQDSNSDGIGDLRGIINRLDYLKELGIDIIWICPVYESPMDDGGYDISDYYSIDDVFGQNEDMDELIDKAGDRGMKILMDLVVNHTSDEHEWFQQALKDPQSIYRDYYIFRQGKNGLPPNNWRSYFGDSAWEPVPNEENMYYLHSFGKKQPDLNWENRQVREDIYEMINYWLDKGLGGFRIDAILNIKKRIEYGLFPPDGDDGLVYIGHWIMNQSGVEKWLKEMNDRTFKRYDSLTVAEAAVPNDRLEEYIGKQGFFSMVFDFSYTDIDVPSTGEWFIPSGWTWANIREYIFINQIFTQAKGWGALYLENHDQPRSVNKYIPDEYINSYSKKMLATLFMLLRGTPFIYQGQELGMTNVQLNNIEDFDDIATHDQYHRALLSGMSEEEAFLAVSHRSRDNSRTPMQWDDSKNAGFSDAEQTWLKVNSNYKEINVKRAEEDPHSVLNHYKELIRLRKNSTYQDALVYGAFVPKEDANAQTIVYERNLNDKKVLVAVNFTNESQEISVDEEYTKTVISNYKNLEHEVSQKCVLHPFESLVLANY